MIYKRKFSFIILFTLFFSAYAVTSVEVIAPTNANVFINNVREIPRKIDDKIIKTGLPAKRNIEVKIQLVGYEDYFSNFIFKNSFDKKKIMVSKSMFIPKTNNESTNLVNKILVTSLSNNLKFNFNGKDYFTDKEFSNLESKAHKIKFYKENEKNLEKIFFFERGGNYIIQADLDGRTILIAKQVIIKADQNWDKFVIDGAVQSENDFIYEDFFDTSKTYQLKITKKNQTIEKTITLATPTNEEVSFSTMILVKGGEFMMGSKKGGDESPMHKVILDDFYIGSYEVTQREWVTIEGSNPATIQQDDLPIDRISWFGAVTYCNKKSELEGLEKCYTITGLSAECDFTKNGYRLPTEAEWEFVAKGGLNSKSYAFSGSSTINDVAWYSSNAKFKLQPVGQKIPNELGVYDMNGNVWEFCWDWHDPSYYSNSPKISPTGPENRANLSNKVMRGGSVRDVKSKTNNTARWTTTRTSMRPGKGFRIVRKK